VIDTLMKGAVISSETLVNIYQTTWRNMLENSRLYTRRRENFNSSVSLRQVAGFVWPFHLLTHIFKLLHPLNVS